MTFETRWDKCDGCLCDNCTKNCYKNKHKVNGRKYGCRGGDNTCIDRRMQCNEIEEESECVGGRESSESAI